MKSTRTFVTLVAILLMALIFAPAIKAQDQPVETVTIPKSSLTDQQKAELAAKALSDKQAAFGKWVGIGDEVGKAVNGGLSAITTQANNFAQTPVGKWTTFVIIFKVVGEKAIQYLVGILTFIIGIPIWIWSYRKYLPKKYVTKVTYDKESGKKLSVEYGYGYGDVKDKNDNSLTADNASWWCIGHWVGLVVLFIAVVVTMFVGN